MQPALHRASPPLTHDASLASWVWCAACLSMLARRRAAPLQLGIPRHLQVSVVVEVPPILKPALCDIIIALHPALRLASPEIPVSSQPSKNAPSRSSDVDIGAAEAKQVSPPEGYRDYRDLGSLINQTVINAEAETPQL